MLGLKPIWLVVSNQRNLWIYINISIVVFLVFHSFYERTTPTMTKYLMVTSVGWKQFIKPKLISFLSHPCKFSTNLSILNVVSKNEKKLGHIHVLSCFKIVNTNQLQSIKPLTIVLIIFKRALNRIKHFENGNFKVLMYNLTKIY